MEVILDSLGGTTVTTPLRVEEEFLKQKTRTSEDEKKLEPSYIAVENINGAATVKAD